MCAVTICPNGFLPLAAGQAAIDEALASLDEIRIGLLEVSASARDDGGFHGAALAVVVEPYVSSATYDGLFSGAWQKTGGPE